MPIEIYSAIFWAVLAAVFGSIRGSLWIYIVGGTGVVAGAALAAPGILLLFLAIGLYRGWRWAWILAIVVSGLGVAAQIYILTLNLRFIFVDVLVAEGGIFASLLLPNSRRFFSERTG